MIGIFRQKAPGNIALLAVFGLLLKLPLFLYPDVVEVAATDAKGYQLLGTWLKNAKFQYSASILAFVLQYIQALMVTGFVNEHRMTVRASFLPGMAYMLITSLLPDWSYLSAPMLSATFVIWAYSTLFHLYNKSSANSSIYNIGLYLGLASLFYFPSLLFVLAVFIGLAVLRPFKLNEFFLVLVGLTTPYYFYALYLFLTDQFHWRGLFPQIVFKLPVDTASVWMSAAVLLLLIPFLFGGFYIQTHLRRMVIQARKNWSICLFWAVVALAVPFINSGDRLQTWVLAAAPFAVFHTAAYLYPPRKWFGNLLFYLFIIFILVQQYGTVFWRP